MPQSERLMNRRDLLALAALPLAKPAQAAAALPPVRTITHGPKFHWFGYYDKRQFDPTGRYVLGMEVGFEHRSPKPDDVIRLGMVDLQADCRWIELGQSSAWDWQQGCMLQWLPASKTEVIYNDREKDRYVARILDVKSGRQRTLDGPIYAVSPDARWAVAPDFRRLGDTRPGYGYNGIADPNRDTLAPKDAGIWRVDLRTGKTRFLLSIAEVVGTRSPEPNPQWDWTGAKHWFNHLLVSPDGGRFIFLHRWTGGGAGGRRITRMFTADPEGRNLHLVDGYGGISHFIWRDPRHILSWANRPPLGGKFYLYEDRGDKVEVVGQDAMVADGHCTYLPGNRWILCDTYPDKQRNQNPYLFDTVSQVRHPLGAFHSPKEYTGEWRCDTHPRISPDGRSVVIDSPHGGEGRQLHLIDISGIVG